MTDPNTDTSPPLMPDVTGFNDRTLMKVRAGLRQVLGSEQVITDCISEMQNQNLLFREPVEDKSDASDGFHTFGELYDHRRALSAVLATIGAINADAWRTKQHHPDDGLAMFDGYFLVGIELPAGPITYHYQLKHWDSFSAVPELEHAPKWDGHTPADVVARLDDFTRHLLVAIKTMAGGPVTFHPAEEQVDEPEQEQGEQ